jgi:hypothetical protein
MTSQHDQLHCDPDELALFAMGETTHIDADHLHQCGQCQSEAASLRHVVRTARSIEADDHLTPPDSHVWNSIRTEIASAASESPSVAPAAHDLSPHGSSAPVRSNVVPLRARRGPWIALAAALGLVFGGVITTTWWNSQTVSPAIIAQAELTGLDGFTASGIAQVQARDGFEVLEVDVTGLPETDGYFEVWLLTPDVDGMISLGALTGGSNTTLPLPPGVALDQFSIVDISEEKFDGDPTHSAISVSRGELAT